MLDDLSSAKGIDYTQLRDLLEAGSWKEADEETCRAIVQAIQYQEGEWVRSYGLESLPCQDWQTIDRLWVRYSYGKFGFSVQKQIYVECGGKLDGSYPDNEVWKALGDRVGWRENNSWLEYGDDLVYLDTLAKGTKRGQLPFVKFLAGGNGVTLTKVIYMKLVHCGL